MVPLLPTTRLHQNFMSKLNTPHRQAKPLLGIVSAALVAMGLAACGGDPAVRTLNVPAAYDSIQEAVDAARPGDLVLIAPGTYNETVEVTTDQIVLRGEDRNTVVLDGRYELLNGIVVAADGVAVENLTVTGYRQNGVLFSGAYATDERGDTPGYGEAYGTDSYVVDGYRASYVTTYNNGLYGLYAFAARNGVFEHSYASGHPDSGFYVGQCRPCNAVLRNLVGERNAIGYYGTNASGDVWVVESVFSNNRLGIAPNSQDAEKLAPQEDTWVVANLVLDNDDPATPEIPDGFFAGGIAVGGGTKNNVWNNRVEGHDGAGILVIPLNKYDPENNVIRGNVLVNNTYDIVVRVNAGAPGSNCFAGNTFTRSDPDNVETLLPCDGTPRTWAPGSYAPLGAPGGTNYRDMPKPPAQPSMPNALTAPAVPAVGVPVFPNPEALKVPVRP